MNPILETLAPLLITAAKQILDAVIPGDKLSDDQVSGIVVGYVAAKRFLVKVVANSTNTYDDEALEAFFVLAEDTLTEAGEEIPVV